MRRLTGYAVVALVAVMLSGCGLAKRAAVAAIVSVQSGAVLSQSSLDEQAAPPPRVHKPCDEMRAAQLNVIAPAKTKPVKVACMIGPVQPALVRSPKLPSRA
jgi:hypothetical protein